MNKNRLTIIPNTTSGKYSEFLCSCGKTKKILTYSVTSGNTKSCGCLQSELQKKPKYTYHAMCNTPTYHSWNSMKYRCKHKDKKYYHGRNITYCERWESFENFYADMGERPEGMTIDRIDVNGNYEPSNCKWSTTKEQCNNKTNNVFLELNGKKQTVMEWSREKGLSYAVIHNRLKLGWNIERALNQPIDISKRSNSLKSKK